LSEGPKGLHAVKVNQPNPETGMPRMTKFRVAKDPADSFEEEETANTDIE
jgi:hypothetical protein